MTDAITVTTGATGSIALALDHYTRYPAEPLTIFLRCEGPIAPGSALQVTLPGVVHVQDFQAPPDLQQAGLSVAEIDDQRIVQIPLQEGVSDGQTVDLRIAGRIQSYYIDHYLVIEAHLLDPGGMEQSGEAAQVVIRRSARFLQYLPELYESDDFINRFLMLFESFWQPISTQIDQVDAYYDPDLTPEQFVPWLSSWIGLPVDQHLPTDRIRALLRKAMLFYQRRGTIEALQTYLSIYTGGEVIIVEKRSRNFVLGPDSRLGVETAVGLGNHPNMIVVRVCVPPGELERMRFSPAMYEQKMRAIVRHMIPAHTVAQVQCDFQEVVPLPIEQRI